MSWGKICLGNSYEGKNLVAEVMEIFSLRVGLAGNPVAAALYSDFSSETGDGTLFLSPIALALCESSLSGFNITLCEKPKNLNVMLCGADETRELFKHMN